MPAGRTSALDRAVGSWGASVSSDIRFPLGICGCGRSPFRGVVSCADGFRVRDDTLSGGPPSLPGEPVMLPCTVFSFGRRRMTGRCFSPANFRPKRNSRTEASERFRRQSGLRRAALPSGGPVPVSEIAGTRFRRRMEGVSRRRTVLRPERVFGGLSGRRLLYSSEMRRRVSLHRMLRRRNVRLAASGRASGESFPLRAAAALLLRGAAVVPHSRGMCRLGGFVSHGGAVRREEMSFLRPSRRIISRETVPVPYFVFFRYGPQCFADGRNGSGWGCRPSFADLRCRIVSGCPSRPFYGEEVFAGQFHTVGGTI